MRNYILVLFFATAIFTFEDLPLKKETEKIKQQLKEGMDEQAALEKQKAELQKQLEDTMKEKQKLKDQLEKVKAKKEEVKDTMKIKKDTKEGLEQTIEKKNMTEKDLEETLKKTEEVKEQLKQMPELNKLTKQLDMMKNLGCFMLVQKKLKSIEGEIKKISKSNPNQNGIKKVIGQYYKTCQEKIPTEDQMKIFGESEANFKQLDDIPIFEYLKDQSLKLNAEDNEYFESYQSMEDQMQKIRKEMEPKKKSKSTKKTNFKSSDSQKKNKKKEKKKEEKKKNKRRGGVNFFGIYLNEVNPLIYMALFGLLLGFPFYYLWGVLFNNEVPISKKDLKRLKKKKNM